MSFLQIPIQTYPNTALGYQALTQAVIAPPFSGQNNTAFGDGALQQNTTGYQNVAIGKETLRDNTTGNNNTSVGMNAAVFNITGGGNTAVGAQAFWIGTGSSNTAIGAAALAGLTTGIQNTGVGHGAGSAITTGSSNVVLGSYTGNQGGLDIRTLSNYIVLSDGSGNPRLWITNTGVVNAPGGFAGIGGGITLNNQSANYTVVASDLGKAIVCSPGSFTVSLTAAATLGSGFACYVWNTGTGNITIDPAASETIDGSATLILYPNEGTEIVCNGSNWITGSKKTMQAYSENGCSKASATTSGAIAIGSASTASGSGASAFGGAALASGIFATAVGANSNATANNASALGTSATASGSQSSAVGFGSQATVSKALALGSEAVAGIAIGKIAMGNGAIATSGDTQKGIFILRGVTTSAASLTLTTDLFAAAANNQVILPNNTSYAFTGTVSARQQASGGTQAAAWTISGLIRREGTAASTTLVASSNTVISNTPGWSIALAADTANGGLSVTVTGAAGTNIRWNAIIETTEITY